MKHSYRVNFYAGTDLRSYFVVHAFNDVTALALAMDELGYAEWVSSEHFRIEIVRVKTD